MKYGFTWKGHWNQKNETKSFLCPQVWNHAWENRLSWMVPLKGVNSLCFIIVDFSLQLLWPRQSSKQHGGPYSDRPDILRLACSFGLQILRGRFCRPPLNENFSWWTWTSDLRRTMCEVILNPSSEAPRFIFGDQFAMCVLVRLRQFGLCRLWIGSCD